MLAAPVRRRCGHAPWARPLIGSPTTVEWKYQKDAAERAIRYLRGVRARGRRNWRPNSLRRWVHQAAAVVKTSREPRKIPQDRVRDPADIRRMTVSIGR